MFLLIRTNSILSNLWVSVTSGIWRVAATYFNLRRTNEPAQPPIGGDAGWIVLQRRPASHISIDDPLQNDAEVEVDWEARSHARSLEQIQTFPEASREGSHEDEISSQSPVRPRVSDDVNALSLTVRRSASYLGLSSVMAALRVIQHVDPHCSLLAARSTEDSGERRMNRSAESSRSTNVTPSKPKTTSMWAEIPAINAYFHFVHPIIPMLDEDLFRNTYMTSNRADSRWKLLLNSVLAMGCVAGNSAADLSHETYWDLAKEELGLSLLSAAHIEVIQALTILSGMYLHYIQQPQLAHHLMGAALRMATTLGLHRDYAEGTIRGRDPNVLAEVELRRRLWWCLLILDGWNLNHSGVPTIIPDKRNQTARIPEKPVVSSPVPYAYLMV